MTELGKSAGVESPTIKKLLLRRLPAQIRYALIAHEDKSTEELCSLADRLGQNNRGASRGKAGAVWRETRAAESYAEVRPIMRGGQQHQGSSRYSTAIYERELVQKAREFRVG
jgi:hypothetical protein